MITPHRLYRALGVTDEERRSAYRALFRPQLDKAALDEAGKFIIALVREQAWRSSNAPNFVWTPSLCRQSKTFRLTSW